MEQRFAIRPLISCFHLETLDRVKAAEPAVPTGWLTLPRYDQRAAVRTAAEHGRPCLGEKDRGSICISVDWKKIDMASLLLMLGVVLVGIWLGIQMIRG